MTDVKYRRVSDGRYEVRWNGRLIGDVWRETFQVESRDRRLRGPLGSIYVPFTVWMFSAEPTADQFDTRFEATEELVRLARASSPPCESGGQHPGVCG